MSAQTIVVDLPMADFCFLRRVRRADIQGIPEAAKVEEETGQKPEPKPQPEATRPIKDRRHPRRRRGHTGAHIATKR